MHIFHLQNCSHLLLRRFPSYIHIFTHICAFFSLLQSVLSIELTYSNLQLSSLGSTMSVTMSSSLWDKLALELRAMIFNELMDAKSLLKLCLAVPGVLSDMSWYFDTLRRSTMVRSMPKELYEQAYFLLVSHQRSHFASEQTRNLFFGSSILSQEAKSPHRSPTFTNPLRTLRRLVNLKKDVEYFASIVISTRSEAAWARRRATDTTASDPNRAPPDSPSAVAIRKPL